MKATNLMIGDWVMAEYRDQDNRPARISALTDNGGINLHFQNGVCLGTNLNHNHIESIHLTAEILEKNGFKNISDHTLKGSDTFRLRVEQRGFDYTITIKLRNYFRLDSYDDRVYTLCEIDFGLNFVHELQHALKLCGIDKEIVL